MRLKKFLIACGVSLMVSFPQNIIGCGGWIDPFDYYVSFYWNDQLDERGYNPFYYTGELHWYAQEDSFTMEEANLRAWTNYFGGLPKQNDVKEFVYSSSFDQLRDFYQQLEKKTAKGKGMANGVFKWFESRRDLEALGYLMYAKQVEPFVTGNWDSWESIRRDSVKMDRLIKNGLQLHRAAKNEEIRLRYAYQLQRLSHYSDRFGDCIRFYNSLVLPNRSEHFLKPLCVALKAGAFFRRGDTDSATYLFSLAFAATKLKRMSNMQGFEWSYVSDEGRERYLRLCQNSQEKANMLGMFTLQARRNEQGMVKDEIEVLREIAALDPASPLLQVIAAREINKFEETYFTPIVLDAGRQSREYYYDAAPDSTRSRELPPRIKMLEEILGGFANNKKISHRGFFALAAAHLAFIRQDHVASENWLTAAGKHPLNARQKDQWNLTRLLVTINNQARIDAAFENRILPQLKWLEAKAEAGEDWKKFYRDLIGEVLARRYHAQNDIPKKALCYSVSYRFSNYNWAYDYLRKEMNSQDLLDLNRLMESTKKSPFEKYLVDGSFINANDVRDVIATSLIREQKWDLAEQWLTKIPASYYTTETYRVYLGANSFADLLYDTHAPTEQDTVKFSKLKFVRQMLSLQQRLRSAKNNEEKAKIHYTIGNGLYQMSYWGNSWMLQAYEWSGSETEWAPLETDWAKEYHGVYAAEAQYKKAFELSDNDEFRARCLFMGAKCYQKQGNRKYDADETEVEQFKKKNGYFRQLYRDFKGTAFYGKAYSTCSYLSDFVRQEK